MIVSRKCRYLKAYKGIYTPRCGCYDCWKFYFKTNTGKTAAWIAILEMSGFNYLEGALGTTCAKALNRFNEELKNAKRSASSTDNQGN